MPEWAPDRRSVVSWVVYDLANTIFALGVSGLYFAEWLTNNDVPDIGLSITVASAMAIVIVLSPWIGARADRAASRARLLIPTTLTAVAGTSLLATFGTTPSLIVYAVALVGFNLGGVVYDSLLPDVSTEASRGTVSGWGIGIGYVGSIIAVVAGGLVLDSYGYPALFRVIAALFLIFSVPAFLFIRERPQPHDPGPSPSLASSLNHLVHAWRRASSYEGVVAFLVGRFLYTDAINTLIGGFLTIFVVNELDFTDNEVQVLLALAIVAAIAGGILGGRITDGFGPARVLNGALYLWMATMAGGILAATAGPRDLAWPVGLAGGFALGITWAADRVYMARISPPERLGEFYGLYATVGRFATLLGPLTWGVVVDLAGLPRSAAMAALIVFVAAGRLVLTRTNDHPRAWTSPEPDSPG
jgi:UMF1 family MFS transporter